MKRHDHFLFLRFAGTAILSHAPACSGTAWLSQPAHPPILRDASMPSDAEDRSKPFWSRRNFPQGARLGYPSGFAPAGPALFPLFSPFLFQYRGLRDDEKRAARDAVLTADLRARRGGFGDPLDPRSSLLRKQKNR